MAENSQSRGKNVSDPPLTKQEWQQKGDDLAEQGRFEEALLAYDRAIRIPAAFNYPAWIAHKSFEAGLPGPPEPA